MEMASEYYCCNEEDNPQLKQCEFNEYHGKYRSIYDRKFKDFKEKSKKANARKEVASIEVYKIITN